MGRTTTPLKQLVLRYVDRWVRASKLLDQRKASCVERVLEDLDSTISLFTHVGAVDPVEVLLLHILLKTICRDRDCG